MTPQSPTPSRQPAAPPQNREIRLTAAFPASNGKPRFVLALPPGTLEDPGVRALVRGETERGGYEYPTRRFIDAHLEPHDLFVDVGAHWGIFSLHAATRHPGRVRVLAIEAHPGNIGPLTRNIAANRLGDAAEVVAVAAGAHPGTAPLVFNSTMGHSLYGLGLPEGAGRLGEITVPVLPIDLLLSERQEYADSRIILKIDVEGYEPEVIEGASDTLDSGRVAAVIWEHGTAFATGERREAMRTMCNSLEARGFRQFRFPHPTMGGPLVPFAPTPECYNVFALAPGTERLPVYDKPDRKPEPLPPLERATTDPEVRTATTAMLIERKATDAARWADFGGMRDGADARAALAAGLIAAGSSVLDIGAGVMALRGALPPGCTYTPADLLPFDPSTLVVDLNDGGFPAGSYDVLVILDIVEFVHDPLGLLEKARTTAPRLIASYRPANGAAPGKRRSLGYFNDFTVGEFEKLLERTGWHVENRTEAAELCMFDCRRR